jgi:hypothetical protein
VCPEELRFVDIVGIGFAAGDVVWGDVEAVEVVLDGDDGAEVLGALGGGWSTENLGPRLSLMCYVMMERGWLGMWRRLRSRRERMFWGMLECGEVRERRCCFTVEKYLRVMIFISIKSTILYIN